MLGLGLSVVASRAAGAGNASVSPGGMPNLAAWYDAANGALTDGAAQFTGSQATRLTHDTLKPSGAFAVGGWFNLDTVQQNSLICQFSSLASKLGNFQLQTDAGGGVHFQLFNQGVGTQEVVGTLAAGSWAFVVGWYSVANNTINLKINANATISATLTFTPTFTDSATFAIGVRAGNVTIEGLSGKADSCFLYSGEFTEAQATALYNNGIGTTYANAPSSVTSGLVSWWDLDETRGVRSDSKGTNHLTAASNPMIDAVTANGGFETAGTGGADVFANWSEATSGSSTVNRDTTVFDSGSASCRFDIDASGSVVSVSQGGLLVGALYTYSFRARASANSAMQMISGATLLNHSITTAWTTLSGTFTATTASLFLRNSGSLGNSIYIDNVTVTTNGPTGANGITSGIATNGDPIRQWLDMSGNSYHAAQTSLSAKPTYLASAINGKPVVSYDGVDDFLAADAVASLFSGNALPFTIYLVVAPTVVTGTRYFCGLGRSASATPYVSLYANGTALVAQRRNDASTLAQVSATAALTANPTVLVLAYDGSTLSEFVNGTSVGTPVTTTGVATLDRFTLGAHRTNGNVISPMSGGIAEAVVFSAAHGTTQRKTLEGYLGNKYGITVSQ